LIELGCFHASLKTCATGGKSDFLESLTLFAGRILVLRRAAALPLEVFVGGLLVALSLARRATGIASRIALCAAACPLFVSLLRCHLFLPSLHLRAKRVRRLYIFDLISLIICK
jgi:hypothetical protein